MRVKKLFLHSCLISGWLLGFSLPAMAAQFKLTQKNPDPANQSWFYVDLILEPEGETINAVEGKVVIPQEFFQTYAVSDGNSIVNLWTEKPSINADGSITFSGVIPGGYLDNNGLLLSMIVKAKQSGDAKLWISEARALLNDGQGTAAKLTAPALNLKLTAATGSFEPPVLDQYQPENFQPVIDANPNLFDGKYFLVFATQDKNSGIDYYAVYESREAKTADQIGANDWHKAASPYLLQDQSLASYVYVKAVDRAGNNRLVEIRPIKPTFNATLLTAPRIFAIIIIIAAVILIGGFRYIINRRQASKRHGRNQGGKF